MTKKINNNDKILKVTDLYHSVDYRLNQTETVFNNPEKYGFVDVAIVNSNGIEMVTIQQEAVEYVIVGYTGVPKTLFGYDKIDKTIIHIPNTNIVVIYNKYQEEETVANNTTQPLVSIKENNIDIYSCCAICRLNNDGKFVSLEREDFDKVEKYLVK